MLPGGTSKNLHDLGHAGLDLYCTDPARHLTTAGWDIYDLDDDLDDLSDLSDV